MGLGSGMQHLYCSSLQHAPLSVHCKLLRTKNNPWFLTGLPADSLKLFVGANTERLTLHPTAA